MGKMKNLKKYNYSCEWQVVKENNDLENNLLKAMNHYGARGDRIIKFERVPWSPYHRTEDIPPGCVLYAFWLEREIVQKCDLD